jgi:hypothetical protein
MWELCELRYELHLSRLADSPCSRVKQDIPIEMINIQYISTKTDFIKIFSKLFPKIKENNLFMYLHISLYQMLVQRK